MLFFFCYELPKVKKMLTLLLFLNQTNEIEMVIKYCLEHLNKNDVLLAI